MSASLALLDQKSSNVNFSHNQEPGCIIINSSVTMKPHIKESPGVTTSQFYGDESCRQKSGSDTPMRESVGSDSANNSGTPPYVKWAVGFDSLLEDPEGQKVFQSYLRAEGALNNLMFWYAVNGFKTQSDKHKKYRLATVIGRTFLKRNSANALSEIASDHRKQILDAIRKNQAENNVFDNAQEEIENFLKEKAYPMFLKSDVYIDCCNKAIQQDAVVSNSHMSCSSSPLNTANTCQTGSLNQEGSPTISTYSTQSTVTPTLDSKNTTTANAAQGTGSNGSTVTRLSSAAADNSSEASQSSHVIQGSTVDEGSASDISEVQDPTTVTVITSGPSSSVPSISRATALNFKPASSSGLPLQQGINDSGSIGNALVGGLATVHEDTELLCKEINLRGGNKGFEATTDIFAASIRCFENEGG